MLDIDHFKKLNDTLGHGEGDICLREIGQALFRNTRQGIDHVARFGSEEFAVVLPEIGGKAAFEMAERIRAAIELLPLQSGWRVTASLGVASIENVSIGDTPAAMLRRADIALYQAKSGGRNKTVLFTDTAQAPLSRCFFKGSRNTPSSGQSMGGARFDTYDRLSCRNDASLERDKDLERDKAEAANAPHRV